MGHSHSKSHEEKSEENDKVVNFNSFKILRSIGKGSFGKVCMVQKTSNEKLFAMKYLNKASCIEQDFVENVRREISLLRHLKHDYIVNLWYTFQDEEDFFIVVDLLMGGDLRYHLSKHVTFTEEDIKIYLLEMASVLDYLKSKCIIHRDIKPDNILLDEKGHCHLTDFNVAIRLKAADDLAKSFAGTKPYVAPDICKCKLGEQEGYGYNVDWWSLAVTLYELLRHKRPFKILNDTSVQDIMDMYADGKMSFSSTWSEPLVQIFLKLFVIDGNERLCSLVDMMKQEFVSGASLGQIEPNFVPSNKHLNYDPTYELEEMMIESKPLHKKKERLKKRRESKRLRSIRKNGNQKTEGAVKEDSSMDDKYSKLFITFNRETDQCDIDEIMPHVDNHEVKSQS